MFKERGFKETRLFFYFLANFKIIFNNSINRRDVVVVVVVDDDDDYIGMRVRSVKTPVTVARSTREKSISSTSFRCGISSSP